MKTKITMMDLAKHIIYIASKNNILVYNFGLQKIIYFALKETNYNFIQEIYDEPFEVWRYGPVVRYVYNHFMYRFTLPINTHEFGVYNDYFEKLDENILKLLKEDIWVLVDKAIKEEKWLKNKDKIILSTSNVQYTIEDILKR